MEFAYESLRAKGIALPKYLNRLIPFARPPHDDSPPPKQHKTGISLARWNTNPYPALYFKSLIMSIPGNI
jgi:hypothetical protein